MILFFFCSGFVLFRRNWYANKRFESINPNKFVNPSDRNRSTYCPFIRWHCRRLDDKVHVNPIVFSLKGSWCKVCLSMLISLRNILRNVFTKIHFQHFVPLNVVVQILLWQSPNSLVTDDDIVTWPESFYPLFGRLSPVAPVNAIVILGPDLHPVHAQNRIVKCADDTCLIIASSMRKSIAEEVLGRAVVGQRKP